MGEDKRSLRVDGASLIERTVGVVSELGRPVILAAGNRELPQHAELWNLSPTLTACSDGPGKGPAAGLLGAAHKVPECALVAVACDMPFLTVGLLRAVVATAEKTRADLVMPVTEDGGVATAQRQRRHPLAAFYSTGALRALRQQVDAGQFSLQRLASTLRSNLCHDPAADVTAPSAHFASAQDLGLTTAELRLQLFNCNTPDDVRRARQLFAQQDQRTNP